MSFGFKNKKSKKKNINQIGERIKKESKLDILAKIDDLKVIQKSHLLKKNFQLPIKLAKDIIVLARNAHITTIVKEQEELMKKIAREVDTNRKLDEIKKNYTSLFRLYDKLVSIRCFNPHRHFLRKCVAIYFLTLSAYKKAKNKGGGLFIILF